jgi:ribosome maturation protein SDO1
MEKGGKRYEVLVDPELVDQFKEDPSSVELDLFLAIDDVFHDSKGGERPTAEAIENTFGTQDIFEITRTIISRGNIQLTTDQRKKMVAQKRLAIIHSIASTAVDPRTKLPHPAQRIEIALDETRYPVDPFKPVDVQTAEVIDKLKPLIPLSFETMRLAFKIPGKSYGGASQVLRQHQKKEEWLSNGDWVCVVEIPAAMKGDLISQTARRAPELEVKEL